MSSCKRAVTSGIIGKPGFWGRIENRGFPRTPGERRAVWEQPPPPIDNGHPPAGILPLHPYKAMKELLENGRLVWRLINDPRVPGWIKFGVPLLVAVYVLSPIDLI